MGDDFRASTSVLEAMASPLVALVCALLVVVYAEERYSSKWDNINVDNILKSDRLLNNYKNCLLDKGSCTADGQELKRVLPDALITNCSKCSAKQRANTEKVVDFLISKKPQLWKELEAKFDPTHIYYNKHYPNG